MNKIGGVVRFALAMCLYFMGHFMWDPIVGLAMCIAFWVGALTMAVTEE